MVKIKMSCCADDHNHSPLPYKLIIKINNNLASTCKLKDVPHGDKHILAPFSNFVSLEIEIDIENWIIDQDNNVEYILEANKQHDWLIINWLEYFLIKQKNKSL